MTRSWSSSLSSSNPQKSVGSVGFSVVLRMRDIISKNGIALKYLVISFISPSPLGICVTLPKQSSSFSNLVFEPWHVRRFDLEYSTSQLMVRGLDWGQDEGLGCGPPQTKVQNQE